MVEPYRKSFDWIRICSQSILELFVALNQSKCPSSSSLVKILQIESRLENPTKYHMLESQRKQVSKISKLAAMFFLLDK